MPRATTNPSTTVKSSAERSLQVQPYLFFEGRCEEALEFYRRALGAEVTMLMRFKDCPPSDDAGMCPPAADIGEKIMHASFRIGTTELMASDGHCDKPANFQGFSLSLTVPTEAEADRTFTALAEQGKVMMPLAKTFFSPRFGMLTDRFGIPWMIYVKP